MYCCTLLEMPRRGELHVPVLGHFNDSCKGFKFRSEEFIVVSVTIWCCTKTLTCKLQVGKNWPMYPVSCNCTVHCVQVTERHWTSLHCTTLHYRLHFTGGTWRHYSTPQYCYLKTIHYNSLLPLEDTTLHVTIVTWIHCNNVTVNYNAGTSKHYISSAVERKEATKAM